MMMFYKPIYLPRCLAYKEEQNRVTYPGWACLCGGLCLGAVYLWQRLVTVHLQHTHIDYWIVLHIGHQHCMGNYHL